MPAHQTVQVDGNERGLSNPQRTSVDNNIAVKKADACIESDSIGPQLRCHCNPSDMSVSPLTFADQPAVIPDCR